MEAIEIFFTTWKNTALAFYSFFGFLGVCTAIAFRLRAMYKRRIDEAQEDAKLDQRHTFQAGYFDVTEKRYDRMLDRMIEIEKDLVKINAILKDGL